MYEMLKQYKILQLFFPCNVWKSTVERKRASSKEFSHQFVWNNRLHSNYSSLRPGCAMVQSANRSLPRKQEKLFSTKGRLLDVMVSCIHYVTIAIQNAGK
jgi:hypothetical protein